MTAREFLRYADCDDDLEHALFMLGQYVGRGDFYLLFPDAEVVTEDGEPLEMLPDEPAAFREYLESHSK